MRRGLVSVAGGAKGELVRDFIRNSLYAQGKGYFESTDCVYSPPKPIQYRQLLGKSAYLRELDKLYAARTEAWLTPSEIFRPWYSRAIARYILKECERENHTSVNIVEVGGGNGTNANHILDMFRGSAPDLYQKMKYTLVEISSAMAERQKNQVESNHGKERVDVINQDILTWKPGPSIRERPTFVIMLEVLDNLPHDKIARKERGAMKEKWWSFNEEEKDDWLEAVVSKDAHGEFVESYRALDDPLVLECARLFLNENRSSGNQDVSLPQADGLDRFAQGVVDFGASLSKAVFRIKDEQKVFVPTGALKLLHVLKDRLPNHRLVAADFETLPPPEISQMELYRNRNIPGSIAGCRNAPLVASKSATAQTVDHPTYLVPLGSADIYFGTDFEALSFAYSSVLQRREPRVMHSVDFLKEYAEIKQTETRSGFNPLLEHYHNTRFLLS